MRKIKGMSYDDTNQRHLRIIKFINDHPKGIQSQFMLECIEKAMNEDDIEIRIMRCIESYMQNKNYQPIQETPKETLQNDNFIVLNDIKDILKI